MKALVADDDLTTRTMLKGVMRRLGYEVTEARDGEEAMQVLATEPRIRLAIVDWVMPSICGPDLIRAARRSEKLEWVYIILLTARNNPGDVVAGIEAGADDYIVKPFDLEELKVRVRAGRRIVDLQSKLEAMALVDPLTGCQNRRGMNEGWAAMKGEPSQRHKGVAVMVLDIDHFKKINDTHGHEAGDHVLREVAQVIHKCCRASDIVCRAGGEEFLVIMPDVGVEEAQTAAERLRSAVARQAVDLPGGGSASVTCSVGVVADVRGVAGELNDYAKMADEQMYAAKTQGRNRVSMAMVC